MHPTPAPIVDTVHSHIFVKVKVPVPLHPEVIPLKFQLPVIVLSFTVPVMVSVFPGGVPEVMVNWKAPVIAPLKFPLRTNDPVCVPPEVKHGVEVVKTRFVPVTAVPLFCISEVVKLRFSDPVSVAVQLPVTVPALLDEPPHAANPTVSARTIAIANCFMTMPSLLN
jgi:hypothetical protein